jgi:hypothetical protein
MSRNEKAIDLQVREIEALAAKLGIERNCAAIIWVKEHAASFRRVYEAQVSF